MGGAVLAFVVGALIVLAVYALFSFLSGGNTQIQSGGSGSIQIQSGGKGNVSISNNGGHVKIKGSVKSLTVNGKKLL